MRKNLLWFLVIVLIGVLVVGCVSRKAQIPQDTKTTGKVKLYYGDENNERFVTEEREITFSQGADKYKIVLEELIKGPQNKKYRANISAAARLYGTIKQNNDLIVDFSQDFNRFAGSIAEIIGVGSVVNTLTQFPEITRVKILVEGNELIGLSGEPRGFMKPFSNEEGKEQKHTVQSEQVILYFGNLNATAVVGETRTIEVSPDSNREGFIKLVLEELIKGPQRQDLNRTIPQEVIVKSVAIENEIAYVDFSEEMHTKHWHGAAGEAMTINSIVKTLTEFDDIKRIKMTVEGEPMNIEHMILEEPVPRNENM